MAKLFLFKFSKEVFSLRQKFTMRNFCPIKEWWSYKLPRTDGVWHKKLPTLSLRAFMLSEHLYHNTYTNANMQYHSTEYLGFFAFYVPFLKNCTGFMAAITIFKKCISKQLDGKNLLTSMLLFLTRNQ